MVDEVDGGVSYQSPISKRSFTAVVREGFILAYSSWNFFFFLADVCVTTYKKVKKCTFCLR